MTGNEYQKLASRTINPGLDYIDMRMHAAFGLASEVGELLGIFQKEYQGHHIDPDHVKKECGDIAWMLAEFITSCGWELEDIMQMNIDKLRARFPDGFDPEKSLHRKEGDV